MISLERVGLDGYASSYPHILSGGEQQRVALARALAPRPAVLLMDEPFSGLDSRLKDSVRAETLAILRQSRATAIVVTHDAEEAMRMGDRIALLRDGRLKQSGRAEELYLQARRSLRRRLLFRAQRLCDAGRAMASPTRRSARSRPAARMARRSTSRSAPRVSWSARPQARPKRAFFRGAISASSNCSNLPFRAPKRRSGRA